MDKPTLENGFAAEPGAAREQVVAKGIMENATLAAGLFTQYSQDKTDRIVEAVARAGFNSQVNPPAGTMFLMADLDGALNVCIDLNYFAGVGHTASIYANDPKVIDTFGHLMNAGRVLVNTPSSQGAVGGVYNTLLTSFTLGCGAGGKNITTENISARHLINIKRVCRRRENERWHRFDTSKYLDENLSWDAIAPEYNSNY